MSKPASPLAQLSRQQNWNIRKIKGMIAQLDNILISSNLDPGSSTKAHLQLAKEFLTNGVSMIPIDYQWQRYRLRKHLADTGVTGRRPTTVIIDDVIPTSGKE